MKWSEHVMITQVQVQQNISKIYKIFFLSKKLEVTTVDTLTGVYAFVNQKGSKTHRTGVDFLPTFRGLNVKCPILIIIITLLHLLSVSVGVSRARGASLDFEQPQRRASQAGWHPLDLPAHAVHRGGGMGCSVCLCQREAVALSQTNNQQSATVSLLLLSSSPSAFTDDFHIAKYPSLCTHQSLISRTQWGAALRAAAVWSLRSYLRGRRRERSSTSRSPTVLSQVKDLSMSAC